MTSTFFATSIQYISTTKDGDKFLVSASYPGAWGDTVKEAEANAIAEYEKAGHTADQLLSIETTELEDYS